MVIIGSTFYTTFFQAGVYYLNLWKIISTHDLCDTGTALNQMTSCHLSWLASSVG